MISVIIPAYNAAEFIERAIRSCLIQTYRNIEVIVINDGSSDETASIVERLANECSSVKLLSVNNGGVARARNIGLKSATGEFVSFLDADDELMPNALETMHSVLLSANVDICSAGVVRNKKEEKRSQSGAVDVWSGRQALEHALEDHPATYSAWGKLYRREKLSGILFPEGKRAHEDSFFVYSCFVAGLSMAITDISAYIYYSNPGSASNSRFSDKFFDILDLAEKKAEIVQERYPELMPKAKNMLVKANMALLHNLCKTKDARYAEREKACLRFVRQNKKYFIAAFPGDRRWFFIINMHLYKLYKFLYSIKKRGT